ncbi:MAG: substrate-binding domain-containing protein [Desulfobacterales bacterium]|jgi:phosphate transport system substrate-binding protein
MMKTTLFVLYIFLLNLGSAQARDEIRIVGSSAVLPFIQTVAENFSATGNLPPALEITGTGNGFRLFCAGIGYEYPDINATPRPMTDTEFAQCNTNGITSIVEMIIGLDGIVLANSKNSPQYDFTTSQIFTALAEEIEIGGEIKKNSFTSWNQIDPSLPSQSIQVMGPPSASVFYDDFIEMIMKKGGASFSTIAALEETRRYEISHSLRKDGRYVESSRNENYIFEWLRKNPEAFGIFGFSRLGNHTDDIKSNKINGVVPTTDTIANGNYPLSRPIYLYIKRKHVDAVKGLQKFLYECASERAIGPEGYLSATGFIPLDDRGRNQARNLALSLAAMSR